MLVADGRAIDFYRKCGFVQTMTTDGKMLLVKPDAANPAIGSQQLAQESCVFRAPPEKHDLAVVLARRGWWSIGIGVGIGGVCWLIRRFKDSV
jgi:hypothetical protein